MSSHLLECFPGVGRIRATLVAQRNRIAMNDNNERPQSLREDIANSISHGFGVVSITTAAPFLLLASIDRGSVWAIVCASIFAATAVLLYLVSTLYHAVRPGSIKRFLQLCDHNAIFLLIAGTYTPFTLGALPAPGAGACLASCGD